jgi:DNA-binding PadR family transcriptional regulator
VAYPLARWFNDAMAVQPLCPLVLSMLAARPRRAAEVARALPFGYPAAHATLDRLLAGGLVRERAMPAGPIYQITRRGRSELTLQRLLWAGLARMRA